MSPALASRRESPAERPANVPRMMADHKWPCGPGATGGAGAAADRASRAGVSVMALARVVALAALVAAAPVRAQKAESLEGPWRFVADPTAGWHFFGPVRASMSAVVGFGSGDLEIPEPRSRFILLIAEPGLRGGRASLAYTQWLGVKGALIARATGLRFWAGAPHRTYAGGELQWIISVLPLGVRVGAFRPQGTAAGSRRTLWMADLSIMY